MKYGGAVAPVGRSALQRPRLARELRNPEAMGTAARTHLWLVLFHGLFAAVFVVRWLRGARPRPRRTASVAPTPVPVGVRSYLVLVLHGAAIALLDAALLAHAVRGDAGPHRLLFRPRRGAGAACMLAAVGLAAWAVAVFRSWRVRAGVAADHELATGGPFAFVRHPIYLTGHLFALGAFLWAPTRPTLVAAALVALFGDLRARAEERVMAAAFGEAYQSYAAGVRRFVPGVY